jgi:hypothetical protein
MSLPQRRDNTSHESNRLVKKRRAVCSIKKIKKEFLEKFACSIVYTSRRGACLWTFRDCFETILPDWKRSPGGGAGRTPRILSMTHF